MSKYNVPADPVHKHTAPEINAKIRNDIKERVREYSTRSRGHISARINSLDHEWDMERVLSLNASALALTGTALGAFFNKKWLYLTSAVLGLLALHSTQGWCPPVPLFRRLGIRTRKEIDQEKFALKVLRGDFHNLTKSTDDNDLRADQALQAVKA